MFVLLYRPLVPGLSIAFSIAEHLLGTQAMTLFVTHYPQITSLVHMYPNVKNVHLKTAINATALPQPPPSNSTISSASIAAVPSSAMKYLHEVGTGPCDMKSGYGLIMAEQSGFPKEVLDDARHFRGVVRDKFPVLLQQQHDSVDRSVGALNSLLQQLLLLKNSTLDTRAQVQYLNNLRDRIPDHVAFDTSRWLTAMMSTGESSQPTAAQGDGRQDAQVAEGGITGSQRLAADEVSEFVAAAAPKVTPTKNRRQDADHPTDDPNPSKVKKIALDP